MAMLLLLYTAVFASMSFDDDVAANEFPSFDSWNTILHDCVTPNVTMAGIVINSVNYSRIADDYALEWNTTLYELSVKRSTGGWTHEQFLAYHINAYNILATKMIIDHACRQDIFGDCTKLGSIRQAGTVFKPIWNEPAGVVNGFTVTLNDVEGTLRAPDVNGWKWKEDARIHATIVCASISCPNLRAEAYEPARVDAQLADAMGEFLGNPGKGMSLDCAAKTVRLSMIFNWFAGDFAKAINASDTDVNRVLAFVAEWSADAAARACLEKHLKPGDLSVSYFDYDWNVNGDALLCAHDRPCYTTIDLLVTLGILFIVTVVISCACWARKRRAARRSGEADPLIQ